MSSEYTTLTSLMVAIVQANEAMMIPNPRFPAEPGKPAQAATILANPLTYDDLIDLVAGKGSNAGLGVAQGLLEGSGEVYRPEVQNAFDEAIKSDVLHFHGVPGPTGKRTGRSAWVYSYAKVAAVAFRPATVAPSQAQIEAQAEAKIRADKRSAALSGLAGKFGKK